MTLTTRKKLQSIILASVVSSLLGGVVASSLHRQFPRGALSALLFCLLLGSYEQFVFQTPGGRRMRHLSHGVSLIIYIAVVTILFAMSVLVTHLSLGWDIGARDLASTLTYMLPVFILYSFSMLMIVRITHFVGIETLVHIAVGTYHRPVTARKIIMFVDMNNSTHIAEALGPLDTRSFVRKFVSQVERAVTDGGGEVYLYKGDGLIAMWDWRDRRRDALAVFRAVDGIARNVAGRGRDDYAQFNVSPTFRVGVHGGEVVISEQGLVRRSIGVFGNTINIAAAMETAAKLHRTTCIVSQPIADAVLPSRPPRLCFLGRDNVKGLSEKIALYGYEPP